MQNHVFESNTPIVESLRSNQREREESGVATPMIDDPCADMNWFPIERVDAPVPESTTNVCSTVAEHGTLATTGGEDGF
jgi:hypothetical protein